MSERDPLAERVRAALSDAAGAASGRAAGLESGRGRGPFTIADAAAASGLSLADAERGLHALVAAYRGHLRATEEGELLFVFPHGFAKPWETPDALRRALRAVGAAAAGAARFVVRAWVAIVLVGYVALFVALFVGLAFARSGSDRRDDGPRLSFVGPVLHLLFEAFWWTFHPFSPFRIDSFERQLARPREREARPPFYERVDRFFFGPKEAPPDPDAAKRAVLAEIRAQKGRIGLADVMRVTGLPRAEIDPLLSRLLVDYGGSVEVSEDGGIAYRFPDLRKTARAERAPRPRPVWNLPLHAPPLTGNRFSEDLAIAFLNGFNLLASGWVILQGLTIDRILALVRGFPPGSVPPPGVPIALGWVPFVFSLLLFALPLGRRLLRPLRERRVARENGRRAVLQAVLDGVGHGGVSEDELARRWRIATGTAPDEKEIQKQVVALGGDVDLDRAEEGIRYRFPDLELEAKAVAAEREAASEAEAKVGEVVFTSEA